MNQNICPNCRTLNTPDKPFCVTCGQPLAQPGYQSNVPPNMPGGTQHAPGYNPAQTAAPKKSRLGLWLAILGGVAVLFVLLGGAALAGIYYFVSTRSQEISYNYNSSNSNSSQSNSLISNTNTSVNSSTVSSELSEDEKYRLFYAASKAGDSALTLKVSKKIGIIDESNKPTPFYKTFTTGMLQWAMRDTEFVKRMDTKQKALDYINSVMPGASTSSTSSTNNISLGVLNGKATNLVTPAYPAAAKAVRASGAVNVQVTLDESGNVMTASSVSGHPLLRASAEQAARASKFNPTVTNGQAVKASGIIVYNFTLQ